MPDTPAVATIIATYNAAAYLHNCLQALLQGTLVPRIIVVDNASTDDTRAIIATHYAGSVHLIANAHNEGFGRANNIGIQHALQQGYTYFFLLNQDAYVAPNAVEQLFRACEAAPEWALLSPVHLNGTGNALDHGFEAYLRDAQLSYAQLMQAGTYVPIPFVNAAAWMVRRSCIEKIGGFNPVFFHYGEDVNYVHRVQYHGLNVGIWPSAIIRHDRHPGLRHDTLKERKRGYQLYVLIGLSNPTNYLSWKALLYLVFKQTVFGLFTGKWVSAKVNFWKTIWLLSIPGWQIDFYKRLTRKPGPHFLE